MKTENIRFTPFLSMNGKAVEAIEFYRMHLGARVVFLKTNEDMKEYDPQYQFKKDQAKYIAHAVLSIGKDKVMLSDEIMNGESALRTGNSFSFCIHHPSLETIQGIYDSLTSDRRVKIVVPLGKSVFSPGYGSVEDPFGVLIQLSTE